MLYRLHKAGYEAHLVGGAVRDMLLGREPKDFDVATNATPEQVRELFRNCRLIGRRFRLAHVHFGPEIIEILSRRLAVPKNYMFIGTPGDRFPHRVEDLGGVPMIGVKEISIGRSEELFKRAADVILSMVLLFLLWPLFLIVGVAIRLDSSGPVLFRQIRVGRGEQLFTCYNPLVSY